MFKGNEIIRFGWAMKTLLTILLAGCLSTGCKDNTLPAEHLSRITVVRRADTPAAPSPATIPSAGQNSTAMQPAPGYHIIAASFQSSDKAGAERMLARLKRTTPSATLLSSPGRYRLSLARCASETEATALRDSLRTATGRPDLWILKTP